MQEEEALIGIYDERGNLVSEKKRKDVNKEEDIIKTANVILFNEYNRILIVKAVDKLWAGKWGGSCAGLVRKDESSQEAAARTLNRELGCEAKLTLVAENYYNFDGVRKILSVFVGRANDPDIKMNEKDLSEGKWVELNEVKKMIDNGECMPTLEAAIKTLNIN